MALPFLSQLGSRIQNYLSPSLRDNPSSVSALAGQPQAQPSIGRTIRSILSTAGQKAQEIPQRISDVLNPPISPLQDEPDIRMIFNTPTPNLPTMQGRTSVTPTPTSTSIPRPIQKPQMGKGRGRNPSTERVAVQPEVISAISQAAQKYGLPPEILYDIAFGESSLNPTLVNPAGPAHGLFQFTPSTWDTVKNYRDMPGSSLTMPNEDWFDPYTSALAAAYLISHGQLGRWDESQPSWGSYYSDDELKPYYAQTLSRR